MALATRPKPTTQHKKRQAQHHRHSKLYLKPYWPYLPMLTIMGIGVMASRSWSGGGIGGVNSSQIFNPRSAGSATAVAHIQALTGIQATWVVILLLIIAITALMLFVARDWYRLHRVINKGEAFIYKRPWLDLAMVFVFTAGFVLTRSGSLIR